MNVKWKEEMQIREELERQLVRRADDKDRCCK